MDPEEELPHIDDLMVSNERQQENGDDVNLSRANEDYASNQNDDGIDR